MLDLTSEVRWWEEWQLRILVHGSLFLQFVLFVGSFLRHARSLKSTMWLAYLSSDALTTLFIFNRHKQPAGSDAASTVQLEVLWAPVLVRHLGGLHSFTAYSVEDNELWGRHLVTLVSQVTVALYVFCRSWSGGDRRLLQVAILLFVPGILKFSHKVWALKAASFHNLMTSSSVYPQRRAEALSPGFYDECLSSASIRDAESLRQEEEHDLSLDEYIHKAREIAIGTVDLEDIDTSSADARVTKKFLFVDLSAPFSRRLSDMAAFFKCTSLHDKIWNLQDQLTTSFLTIYTNAISVISIPSILIMLMFPFMTLASAVLFGQSHKQGFKENDVIVTYILLWCVVVLELLPLFSSPCIIGTLIFFYTAAQHNVLSFSARRSKPTKLMRVSAILGLKDYVNKHRYIQHEPSQPVCRAILASVLRHLTEGWNEFIVDATSYKRFNNLRGQWVMRRHQVRDQRLLWSLQVPFDLSVLIWHVATELCFHHPKSLPWPYTARRCSKVISDYMIYLLLIRPEMLLPGTRPGLFTIASDDIEIMLECDREPPSRDERTTARRILRAARHPTWYADQIGPWIPKACKLAEDLVELLDNEEERWVLIRGVWVEMLCYSAGRCRGYLHAKSMGEGVEFLSYVWLLLLNMGMETLADKLQRPEPGAEEIGATSQPGGVPPV